MNKLNQLQETNKPYSIVYLETTKGAEIVLHGFTQSVLHMINGIGVEFELVDVISFDTFQSFDDALHMTMIDFEGCNFINANEMTVKDSNKVKPSINKTIDQYKKEIKSLIKKDYTKFAVTFNIHQTKKEGIIILAYIEKVVNVLKYNYSHLGATYYFNTLDDVLSFFNQRKRTVAHNDIHFLNNPYSTNKPKSYHSDVCGYWQYKSVS